MWIRVEFKWNRSEGPLSSLEGESRPEQAGCRHFAAVAMKALLAESRHSFKDLAKAGMLYPDDAMTQTYLLYGMKKTAGSSPGTFPGDTVSNGRGGQQGHGGLGRISLRAREGAYPVEKQGNRRAQVFTFRRTIHTVGQ
jgi:hypothetical protein